MSAEEQGRPDHGGQGARESGDPRGTAAHHLNSQRPASQGALRVIHIPDGAWEAAEREQRRPIELAREGLKRLAPTRTAQFSTVLAIGRLLFAISPTELLPAWTAWASANSYFTAERCTQYWSRFPTWSGKSPTLGYLITLVRQDSGDASFGKRGGA